MTLKHLQKKKTRIAAILNRPADASDWDESEDSGSDMNCQRLNKDWPGLDNSLCFHLLLIYLPLGFVCGHFTGGSWDIHTGPNLQKTIYLPPFIFHVFFFFLHSTVYVPSEFCLCFSV